MLYPGENFEKLAIFLNKALTLSELTAKPPDDPFFATLYLLQAHETTPKEFPSEDLSCADDLPRVDQEFKSKTQSTAHRLLFLRGFPTPEWLCKIGSFYRLDPEFFRRHLDLSSFSHQQWFSSPSLPSASRNLLRLRVTTLARRRPKFPDLELARQKAQESLSNYLKPISELRGSIGESIVRKFSLHSENYFSLEQDISLCCCRSGQDWTGKFYHFYPV